jgi:hypothetical protein
MGGTPRALSPFAEQHGHQQARVIVLVAAGAKGPSRGFKIKGTLHGTAISASG